MVLEEVTTRDETSAICTNGARALPSGALTMDGPPTSHSDTGIDRVAFLQGNFTHDNTQFVNGTPVGARDIFQVCNMSQVVFPLGFSVLPSAAKYNQKQEMVMKS